MIKWPSTCTCCKGGNICDLLLDSSGGDAGFCQDYPAPPAGTIIRFTINTYTQKDRVVVTSNPVGPCSPDVSGISGTVLFDTGCVGVTGLVKDAYVPGGSTVIRVIVIPNCEGGSGTAWDFTTQCIEACTLAFTKSGTSWEQNFYASPGDNVEVWAISTAALSVWGYGGAPLTVSTTRTVDGRFFTRFVVTPGTVQIRYDIGNGTPWILESGCGRVPAVQSSVSCDSATKVITGLDVVGSSCPSAANGPLARHYGYVGYTVTRPGIAIDVTITVATSHISGRSPPAYSADVMVGSQGNILAVYNVPNPPSGSVSRQYRCIVSADGLTGSITPL
jgi:hypothetical protein